MVLRIPTIAAALLCLCAGPEAVQAKQATASFKVGIVIGSGQAKSAPREARSPRRHPQRTYTWNAAAISVRALGFKAPRRISTAPGIYWFAAKRGGRHFHVAVSKSTGAVLRISARAAQRDS